MSRPRSSTSWAPRPVPRVTVPSTWVSPRVNTAEPCALGSTSTSIQMGRTSLGPRPSARRPSSRIRRRSSFLTTSSKALWASLRRASSTAPSGEAGTKASTSSFSKASSAALRSPLEAVCSTLESPRSRARALRAAASSSLSFSGSATLNFSLPSSARICSCRAMMGCMAR
ncbi:Uncharacterised protein [Acinetobacter baumannii]|nr:Uncharacterised protein [Acinetobacter baumannii]